MKRKIFTLLLVVLIIVFNSVSFGGNIIHIVSDETEPTQNSYINYIEA